MNGSVIGNRTQAGRRSGDDADQDSGAGFPTWIRERGFWAIAVTGVLIFFPLLFLDETLFYRDLYSQYLPQKKLMVELIRNGEFPLWNPYRSGGEPFLANPSAGIFYPSNILYFVFLPVTALNLDAILHTILAALAAYVLARELGFHQTTAVIVGAVYGFSGYALSLITLFVRILALPYLPLLILFWHRFLSRKKCVWLVCAVFCGVLQVFSGAVEWTGISVLTLLGWSVLYPFRVSLIRRTGLWLILCFMIAGLGSIQLLPAMELISHTHREQGLHYDHFSTWSMHPKRLPELIVPNFIGRIDSVSGKGYWGGRIEDESAPFITSIYFGSIALIFAMMGGLVRDKDPRFPPPVRRFLLGLSLAGLLLSMGRHIPGFYYLYLYVPFLNIFRFPVKFLMFSLLPVALLAGYASEYYLRTSEEEQPKDRKIIVVFWLLASMLLTISIAFASSSGFAGWFQDYFFEQQAASAYRSLCGSLFQCAAVALTVSLLLSYRRLNRTGRHRIVLAGVLLLDLLLNGSHVNTTAPKHLFTLEPNLVSAVKEEIGSGRLYRSPTRQEVKLRVPSDDLYWAVRWELEVMNYYLASLYGIPVMFSGNVHGMQQKRDYHIGNLIGSLPLDRKIPILSAAGVTLMLTAESGLERPGLKRVATVQNTSNLVFYLYRNEDAMPRVYFARSVVPVPSDEEALQALSQPGFHPKHQLILEGDVIRPESAGGAIFRFRLNEKRTNRASYSVFSDKDGYLVFVENFYPGWKVRVNGIETPVFRANYLYSAVYLKAGNHLVEREYSPRSLKLGFAVCFLSAVLLFFVVIRMSSKPRGAW